MAVSSGFYAVLAVMIINIMIPSLSSLTVEASGPLENSIGWLPTRSGCRGTVAECLSGEDENEEFGLDSESNRRILASSKHISYGALQRNNVPCSQRGASYYNCKQGGQANPYNRGCSAITRCRS
ncbi:Rapid ALkalinization Factor [Heracleum sosnowskyi]|uniref:Rapid ALkalinization Factor n=1 Tax=Heracleum sosnowskyi TaxID=360622 RepID=A0AAD8INR7_9APIA|nr:Rapid ALkalinization Factor [Heracleum sosnowskyi]